MPDWLGTATLPDWAKGASIRSASRNTRRAPSASQAISVR